MTITSLQNSFVKKINSLKTSKGRKTEQLYILEGIKPVQEVLAGSDNYEIVACSELISLSHYQLPKTTTFVSENVFRNISTVENPEGVMAILPFEKKSLEEDMVGPYLVLCGIQDPGNVGTLLRSAEAFGFTKIIFLEPSADPYQPKATRASMGSILRLEIFFSIEVDFIKFIEREHTHLVGLDVHGEEVDDITFLENMAVLVGSESHGIPSALVTRVHQKVRIPMVGKVESLNASIAGSLMMHQIFLKRNK